MINQPPSYSSMKCVDYHIDSTYYPLIIFEARKPNRLRNSWYGVRVGCPAQLIRTASSTPCIWTWIKQQGMYKSFRQGNTYSTFQLMKNTLILKLSWFTIAIWFHTADVMWLWCTQCLHKWLKLLLKWFKDHCKSQTLNVSFFHT
jgi:hypothetical protein